jgi:GlpG protein
MPQCFECGKETPRSEMRGPPDELRCESCAARYGQIYQPGLPSGARARKPVVTLCVCAAATVVSFAYWSHNPVADWFVPNAGAVWDGQVWRLLTDAFPHINPMHLLFNLYWLWRFGQGIEPWLGWLRYAGLLLLLAVGSSATSFLATEAGIGLSGVGYGLFGLLFALRRDKDLAAREMQPQVVQLFIGWFFLCIFLTYANVMRIGNVAHGAGAVLGWLVGQAILARQRNWLIGAISALVVGLVLATQYMPWDGMYAWHRAAQLAERGEFAQALPWYEQAERAYPNNRELREYVDWLRQTVQQEKAP